MRKKLASLKKLFETNVILKRFLGLFSIDILTKASGFILLPIYLKLMSQEEFGMFGYILSLISNIGLLLNLGLYVAQSKLFHDYQVKEKKELAFTLNLMILFFLILVLIPVYFFKLDYPLIKVIFSQPIPYQNYRYIILAGIVINIFSFMLFNFLMTSEKIKIVQIYNLLRLFVGNGLVLLVLFIIPGDQTLSRISVYYLVEAVLYIGIGTFYFRNMLPSFNFNMAGKALVIGFPTVISAVVGIFYNFSDKFIIEKVGGFKDMAIYNLGSTVSGVILMTFSTFHNIWLPLFYKEKNIKLNYRKTNKAAILLVAAFSVLSLGLWLATWFLIRFNIISFKYQPVLWLIPVQFGAQILQSITFLYNNYVTYFEKTYISTIVGLMSSALILGLNLLLIPRFNALGAAYALLITNIISFSVYFIISRKMVHRRIHKAAPV